MNISPTIGKKIGIVAAVFITTDMHFNIAVQTVLSLFGLPTSHSLFPVAVVNGCTTGGNELAWFKKSFDRFIVNDRNNLARAWNRGIKECLDAGCDFVLVINLDLLFHPQFLDNLVRFALDNPQPLIWCGRRWPDQTSLPEANVTGEILKECDASCFMIDRRLPELVGYFDEQFEPAYLEDKDLLYRVQLAQQAVLSTPSARYFHYERITLKGSFAERHEEFIATIRRQNDEGIRRYERKWGGLPGQERFTVPYNGTDPT